MSLLLEIVTPEAKTFSGQVDTVVVPGVQGEAGLLPNHAPLVSTLQPGELRYTADGKEEFLAVGEGFAEISGDRVAVITDLAVGDSDIDEAAVEEAMKKAEESMKNLDGQDPEEMAALQVAIQKSLAQLNVKRKRRSL